MKRLLVLAAVLAACSGGAAKSTAPQGLDPTVLITNSSLGVITSTWYDQSGQVLANTVPSGTTLCQHFTGTLPTDSVRFVVRIDVGGGWSEQTSPWFDPLTGLPTASAGSYPYGAEYWVVETPVASPGYPAVGMRAVKSAPC